MLNIFCTLYHKIRKKSYSYTQEHDYYKGCYTHGWCQTALILVPQLSSSPIFLGAWDWDEPALGYRSKSGKLRLFKKTAIVRNYPTVRTTPPYLTCATMVSIHGLGWQHTIIVSHHSHLTNMGGGLLGGSLSHYTTQFPGRCGKPQKTPT